MLPRLAFMVLSLVAGTAHAQTANVVEPELFVRAGGWSHDRDFGRRELWVTEAIGHVALHPFDRVDVASEAFLQIDSGGRFRADLREGWVRWRLDAVTLTGGRPITVWGRADRLNPTDVIGSRDFTRLTTNDDDQRRGVGSIGLAYAKGDWTVTALWLPEFRANIVPVDRSVPGVVVLSDQQRRSLGQFALKLDRTGHAIDGSLSFFSGIDRNRDLVLVSAPAGQPPGERVAVQQQYGNIQMFGGDLAGTIGRVGWRAEAAYSHIPGVRTAFSKRDFLWLVAGVDLRAFGWDLNIQYSLRHVFGWRDQRAIADPIVRAVALQSATASWQLREQQNGFAVRLARNWLNDTVQVELAVIGQVETGDAAIRPTMTYAINDQLKLSMGADLFLGPSLSFFGRVRTLSGVWLVLTRGW